MPIYPKCLIDALAGFGQRPTGDLEWDRAVLKSLQTHERNDREPWATMHALAVRATDEMQRARAKYANLTDDNTYAAHVNFFSGLPITSSWLHNAAASLSMTTIVTYCASYSITLMSALWPRMCSPSEATSCIRIFSFKVALALARHL